MKARIRYVEIIPPERSAAAEVGRLQRQQARRSSSARPAEFVDRLLAAIVIGVVLGIMFAIASAVGVVLMAIISFVLTWPYVIPIVIVLWILT